MENEAKMKMKVVSDDQNKMTIFEATNKEKIRLTCKIFQNLLSN